MCVTPKKCFDLKDQSTGLMFFPAPVPWHTSVFYSIGVSQPKTTDIVQHAQYLEQINKGSFIDFVFFPFCDDEIRDDFLVSGSFLNVECGEKIIIIMFCTLHILHIVHCKPITINFYSSRDINYQAILRY